MINLVVGDDYYLTNENEWCRLQSIQLKNDSDASRIVLTFIGSKNHEIEYVDDQTDNEILNKLDLK